MSMPDHLEAALPRADHVLGIYDTDDFLVRTVAGQIRLALEAPAIAVAVLPVVQRQAVERELAATGLDLTAAKQQGDFFAIDTQDLIGALTAGGVVDLAEFRAKTDEMKVPIAERGLGIHACGDFHSSTWAAGRNDLVLELESLWNGLPEELPLRLLCLFDSQVFHDGEGDDPFLALLDQHVSVDPVEDYGSLVDPTDPRSVALLAQQQDNRRAIDRLADRIEALQAALDKAIREASEQRTQFDRALASRDVIGQAKGILMVRWRIDSDTAFTMLRGASHRSHRKLHEVAQAVVAQQLRRN